MQRIREQEILGRELRANPQYELVLFDRLAELSRAALRYGQSLALTDPLRLSLRLYGYNRRPLNPAWKRLLPDADAVERHLGIGVGGPHRRLLDRSWSRSGPSEPWLSW